MNNLEERPARCDTSRPRIGAVIPALNEARSIARVVERLPRPGSFSAVVVVDNGSTDWTGDIARRAGASVVREERRCYGYACKAGVLASRDADVIVLLDGDAADDPDDLPYLLNATRMITTVNRPSSMPAASSSRTSRTACAPPGAHLRGDWPGAPRAWTLVDLA